MKIAIAGFGVEGQANYEYYRAQANIGEIVIFDERTDLSVPKGAKVVLGPGAFEQIPEDFMVIRTNSLPPRRIVSGGKIWTGTNEFFARCPAQIIGITGSKGKGTTSSFVASILRAGGRKVHLLGNIGIPALRILSKIKTDDIVVFELSSFQLWDVIRSPHIAVITNLEPDHLNVHKDFAEYATAKANIAKFQTTDDIFVYNQEDNEVKKMTAIGAGQHRPYPNTQFAHIKDKMFYYNNRRVCDVSAVKLPGYHNLMNAMAAIDATYDLVGGDGEVIARGLSDFTGLPHRLKFVREVGGVSYYDDSIATTPGSAIAALASFDAPKILIVGGSDKGAEYDTLARAVATQKMRAVITIGANRARIIDALRANKVDNILDVESKKMADIVALAARVAHPGDTVIMSPAAASFDMFKSYSDRGEQFVAAVEKL